MNVILCGYHWTGCKALELLLDRGYTVYVYTHKTENAVADLETLCMRKKIGYTLEKISVENMPFKPDVICFVYYRYLISEEVIEYSEGRLFNLHPALLPKYRGCSSLTWAMIRGEKECGFTWHYIDSGCDTGNIIIQKRISIEDFDTQLTLYHRVMFEAMKFFLEAFDMVLDGKLGIRQEGESSYYPRGCPYDGKIDGRMDDGQVERFIRAMVFPPYPYAVYNDNEIRTYMEFIEVKENEIS